MFIRDCQGVFRVLKKNRAGSKARERQKAPSKSHGGKVLSGELTLRWGPGQTMAWAPGHMESAAGRRSRPGSVLVLLSEKQGG